MCSSAKFDTVFIDAGTKILIVIEDICGCKDSYMNSILKTVII